MRHSLSTILPVALLLCAGTTEAQTTSPAGEFQQVTIQPTGERRGGIGMSFGGRPILTGTSARWEEHPEVQSVVDGSAADRAGVRPGDYILSVNGKDAREGQLFPDLTPGTEYRLRIERDGREMEVTIVVSEPRPGA